MMHLEDIESPGFGEILVRGIIVSFNLVSICFSLLWHLKMHFFKPFLKLIRDFVNEGRVPDEVKSSITTELLDPDYITVLENCFRALLEERFNILIDSNSKVLLSRGECLIVHLYLHVEKIQNSRIHLYISCSIH
jgi:hypothetical protein